MNDSSSRYFCPSLLQLDMPWPYLVKFITVCAIVSFVIVFCNSALIYGLYKMQQLNTITNKLILLINLTDLGTGLFTLPSLCLMAALRDKFRNCVCELALQFSSGLLAYFSYFMLMCVTADRYLHVTKLKKYSSIMNEFRMKIIVAICFLASATISYLLTKFPSFSLHVLLNVLNLFCLSFVLLVYSRVLRNISIHIEKMKEMFRSAGQAASNREARRQISATKTVRLVLGTLLLLYLPYIILSAVLPYYKYQKETVPPLFVSVIQFWVNIIVCFNGAINAILFGYGNSVVRKYLIRRLFRRRRVSAEEQK